jgi:hypothetical protein
MALGCRGAVNFDLIVELREGGHHSGNWGADRKSRLAARPCVGEHRGGGARRDCRYRDRCRAAGGVARRGIEGSAHVGSIRSTSATSALACSMLPSWA